MKDFPKNRRFGDTPPRNHHISCEEVIKITKRMERKENVSPEEALLLSEHFRLCSDCRKGN